ncbi:5-formyltetrahydrofolate cyclo-ligase [Flavobacterium agricola]|uniref:5-formyltetrahydrofolate cyclo-ligase n=1 Tax=Flavobacterium agricola TaxID=2870839 RepID=A0ABY6M2J9_9FLAO|nr:5-formyltetrahydrofolate cyclo-ligase [Flavobacterium agricola]UYW01133.1 5-formyltetrahydrofolate cyclo-ligase [Flavobacterium agricola]
MLKKDLRTKYKALRQALTKTEQEDLSLAIANNLLKLNIWQYNNFHVFLPITRLHEINTEYLMHILQGKDKNVILSKSDFKTNKMVNYLLTDNTKIETNSYGIPEPTGGIKMDEQTIDVVFVPLLAFDKKGNRVGYGKGFYDLFLSKCKPNVIKVGVSFFEAENAIEDAYEKDIALDFCVTPNQLYTFR